MTFCSSEKEQEEKCNAMNYILGVVDDNEGSDDNDRVVAVNNGILQCAFLCKIL